MLAEAEKTYSSFSFAVKKRFRKDVRSDQINNKSIKYRFDSDYWIMTGWHGEQWLLYLLLCFYFPHFSP